jgi:integrase/recombinase XerD
LLRDERPDYIYLRDLFKQVRNELNITVTTTTKRLSYVPTEATLKKYYDLVWSTKNTQHMIVIKLLLYTGIREQELVNIKLQDVDLTAIKYALMKAKEEKTA